MSKFNASLDRACAVARAEWSGVEASQATSSHHRIVGAIRHVVAAAVACLFCRLVQGRHGCAN